MIWFLALLLLASVAALGYRQGAIKVAFSLVGILIGALLAGPLGRLLKPLLGILGMKDPLLQYLVAPIIVFVLINIIFKVIALQVHLKVECFYKYSAGDLRLALWERLNHHLGGCLGLANGALYLVLIGVTVFPLSYATFQLASSDEDPRWMRWLNTIGEGMQSSGFNKVARALDSRKDWYAAADFAGLMYNNSLAEARLSRYPAFLGLSEKPEFKDLGGDKEFSELRLRKRPIMEILDHQKVMAIRENPELLRTIWEIVSPELSELDGYIRTGISAKYAKEPILGRWMFDANQAMLMVRRAKPNMSSREAQHVKRWLMTAFTSTSMVAMTDHNVLVKDVPQVRVPPPLPANPAVPATIPTGTVNFNGQWKGGNGSYQLTLSEGGTVDATVDGDRLKFNFEGLDMAFLKEI
jgi:uncharacterized membrane protein required for colicin V production